MLPSSRILVAALLASSALAACSTSADTSAGTTTGAAPLHDAGSYQGACKKDADCTGTPCVALTPGGPSVCGQTTTPIAPTGTSMCQEPDAGITVDAGDNCSSTSDCACGSACYDSVVVRCWQGSFSGPSTPGCVTDACSTDDDCAAQPGFTAGKVICAPAGVYGRPVRTCMIAHCHTDADCTAKPGGTCGPISDPCGCSAAVTGSLLALACVYPGGCQDGTDCGSNETSPSGAFLAHCTIDEDAGTGVCAPGGGNCPD